MKRSASARWSGGIREGSGTVSTQSGVLTDTPYSFRTRFEGEAGSNPEELIAAAHAGCFSMALSGFLGSAGHPPTRIDTEATVTLRKLDLGFEIASVHLDVTAVVPGMDEAAFLEAATTAKGDCPVSKVLNAEITMDARLADEG